MELIALDTETHLIRPGCITPRLVCVTTSNGSEEIYLRDKGLVVARKIIEEDEMVGHHVFFDLGVLAAEDSTFLPLIFKAIEEGRIHCTKIRQMIIDNAEGQLKYIWNEETGEFKKVNFSLATLVWRHFGKKVEKGEDTWRLRYNQLDGVPLEVWPEDAVFYAVNDAKETRAVYLFQEKYCAPRGLPGGKEGEIGQTKAAWALYLLGAWGVRTEKERVAKLRADLTKEYEEQKAIAQKWGFIRKGVKESRNMAAIREAVKKWYNANNRPMALTPKGAIATSREQLTEVECSGCGFPFGKCSCDQDGSHRGLWATAETVRLQKVLTTYVPVLERGTEVPINASYNPILETFRTSCSRPNLQNPPRKGGVRECFVPRPGWVFAFCDYDTLEMLTLAQTCIDLFGYSEIAKAAHRGEDFHLSLAADMLYLSYDEAKKRLEAGDEKVSDFRQLAKVANYGFGGGMGGNAFVSYAKGYGMEVKLSMAKKLHSSFRSKWIEMKDYFAHCSALVGQRKRAKVVKFPRSGLMRGEVSYTATCNGYFQHLAAMGAKEALYEVTKECYINRESDLYGCRPWLFAHDEIGLEIPYSGKRASDAALRLQKVMIDVMQKWCPDVPIGATAVMARRWYKGAKAVWQNGIMVPSRPEGKKWVADL